MCDVESVLVSSSQENNLHSKHTPLRAFQIPHPKLLSHVFLQTVERLRFFHVADGLGLYLFKRALGCFARDKDPRYAGGTCSIVDYALETLINVSGARKSIYEA